MKLDKYLKSKINRKIIKFFFENPSCIDTSRSIATWVNEDVNKTEKSIKELVEAKVLIPHGNDITPAYGYTTDAYVISQIKSYFEKFKSK